MLAAVFFAILVLMTVLSKLHQPTLIPLLRVTVIPVIL